MARGVNKVLPAHLCDLYVYGFSIPEVSDITGLHRSTIRHHLANAKALRSRAEGVRKAAADGRLGSGMRGRSREFSEKHKDNIRKAKIAHGKLNAKGVSLKPSGYVEITVGPNKGRLAHRVAAEIVLGRPLTSGEHVHHIDGNKANNDPENLQVLSVYEHCSMHAKENSKNRRRNSNGTWC